MKMNLLLAFRNITGNRRKSIFIILIISIVLIMAIIVISLNANLLNYEAEKIKTETGAWHLICPISRYEVITDIDALDEVEQVAAVQRSTLLNIDGENYEFFFANGDKLDLLINPRVQGVFPKEENEVLVPDWFLRKHSVEKLPYALTLGENQLIVTGTYLTTVDDVFQSRTRLFFGIDAVETDWNTLEYSTSPVGQLIVDGNNTLFAFIRLSPKCDYAAAIHRIASISGVGKFQILQSQKSNYLEHGMILNKSLLVEEGFTTDFRNNPIENNLAIIIDSVVVLVVLISVSAAMNLIISEDGRLCGMLLSLGFAKKNLIFMYLIQSVMLTVLSIPIGGGIGIAGSYTLMRLSMAKLYGAFVLPWAEIIGCCICCIIAVIGATLFPAIKATRVSCIEAIKNFDRRDRRELSGWAPKFINTSKHRPSFVFRYSVRNIWVNRRKILSFIVVISLLLMVFIRLSYELEYMRKEGNGRQSYRADYVIKSSDPLSKIIDDQVINQCASIEGIDRMYSQYCIDDTIHSGVWGKYNYFILLNDELVTEQGYMQFDLSSPITRPGYDETLFVQMGISGYGEKELMLASEYLIEGEISIDQMKSENIILLPKYISWLENMDIPYTRLKIGDQITIVENSAISLKEIKAVKKYTFTIGGFVDSLPLPQVNGVSNGFVAIMHKARLEQFQNEHIGLSQIYIDGSKGSGAQIALEAFCADNQLGFWDNTTDYRYIEKEMKQNILTISIYSIFLILGIVVVLSLFNMLLSNIMMRLREFSLLCITGVRKNQRNCILILETLAFSVPGLFVGVGGGVFLILCSNRSSNILTTAQIIPGNHILISFILILTASVLALLCGIQYIDRNMNVNLDLC